MTRSILLYIALAVAVAASQPEGPARALVKL